MLSAVQLGCVQGRKHDLLYLNHKDVQAALRLSVICESVSFWLQGVLYSPPGLAELHEGGIAEACDPFRCPLGFSPDMTCKITEILLSFDRQGRQG